MIRFVGFVHHQHHATKRAHAERLYSIEVVGAGGVLRRRSANTVTVHNHVSMYWEKGYLPARIPVMQL